MTQTAVAHAPAAARSWRRFALHFGEMVAAMVAGMVMLGAASEGVLAMAGTGMDDLSTAWMASLMAFNMTVPMVAWMHHRGHALRHSLEMAAAMVLPTLAAIGLDVADVIGPDAVLAVQHAVMLPAMLAAMLWRREHYAT